MNLVWPLIHFVLLVIGLHLLRITTTFPLAGLSAVAFRHAPSLKKWIHYIQGAMSSVLAIYLGWFLLHIWIESSYPLPSNIAATMGLLNLLSLLSSRNKISRETGVFADSLGGLLGSLAIWATGIEFHSF